MLRGRQRRNLTLACVPSSLADDTVSTLGGVVAAAGGFQVVSTSVLPNSQHEAMVTLARTLLDSNTPFGAQPLGAAFTGWVFAVQADVATGKQTSVLYGTHLVLTAASALNTTAIEAAATPFPPDAFVKVHHAHARVADGGPRMLSTECAFTAWCQFYNLLPPGPCAQYVFTVKSAKGKTRTLTSAAPTATFTGLAPGTKVRKSVPGCWPSTNGASHAVSHTPGAHSHTH